MKSRKLVAAAFVSLAVLASTLAAGVVAGVLIGWMIRRKQRCDRADVREKAY
jgi:F0F1-type ATP synthase assembly protein I